MWISRSLYINSAFETVEPFHQSLKFLFNFPLSSSSIFFIIFYYVLTYDLVSLFQFFPWEPLNFQLEFSFSAIIHSYHVFGLIFSSSFFPVNKLCLKISKADSADQETQVWSLNYWVTKKSCCSKWWDETETQIFVLGLKLNAFSTRLSDVVNQLLGFLESRLDLSSGLSCVITNKPSIITFINDMLNLASWLVNMGSESQL